MATRKKAKKSAARIPANKATKSSRKALPVKKSKPAKKKPSGKSVAKKSGVKKVVAKAVSRTKTPPKPAKKSKSAPKVVTPATGHAVQGQAGATTTSAKTAVSPIAAWPFPTGPRP